MTMAASFACIHRRFKLTRVRTSKANTSRTSTEFTSLFKDEFRIELKILEVLRAKYKRNTRRAACCPGHGRTGRMDLCLFW